MGVTSRARCVDGAFLAADMRTTSAACSTTTSRPQLYLTTAPAFLDDSRFNCMRSVAQCSILALPITFEYSSIFGRITFQQTRGHKQVVECFSGNLQLPVIDILIMSSLNSNTQPLPLQSPDILPLCLSRHPIPRMPFLACHSSHAFLSYFTSHATLTSSSSASNLLCCSAPT